MRNDGGGTKMNTDEKYKSIGGEKFWYEALESAWDNIYEQAVFLSSLYTADILGLYELIKAEIDHITDFEGTDKLPPYSKRFIEDWRQLNVMESGEEAVRLYEEHNGPIYKRLGPLISWGDKEADFDQILRRFKLIVKFGMDSGIFTLKEKEAPWETIVSSLNFPINKELKNNKAVRELARYLKEDREEAISNTGATEWAVLHANYLEGLKNGSVTLDYRKMIEGEDRGPDSSFSSFIKTNLLRTGMVSVLYGKAGTGKSHFLSWLITRSLVSYPNWDIYTNLPLFWFDHKSLQELTLPNVYKIESMSEMLYRSALSVLNKRQPVVILDEMDQVLTSRRWNSKENLSWETFMNIERHLKIRGPLLVYHITRAIPEPMRERRITEFVYKMVVYGRMKYLYNCDGKQKIEISGFAIPYATLGTFSFQIDVDMGKLLRSIQTTEITESATFIRDHIGEFKFDLEEDEEHDNNDQDKGFSEDKGSEEEDNKWHDEFKKKKDIAIKRLRRQEDDGE
jgi:hypothetical protein